MTKVIVETDCGNAPKKLILRDLNISFAEGDINFVSEIISDDCIWNRIGMQLIEGKENCINALAEFGKTKVDELQIENIITHGKDGAVNGIMKIGAENFAFCNIYKITGHDKNAKVKQINSYVIKS